MGAPAKVRQGDDSKIEVFVVKKVAVFGIGYVGCVTAACLSRDGHDVIGVDLDAAKVDGLNAGQSPVAEPGLDELVSQGVKAGTLRATVDLEEAVRQTEIAMITVGTPSARDGSVSSSAVESVLQQIGQVLRGTDQAYSVVVRSTLLPGILEERLAPLLVESSGRELGDSLRLCNNPEFLRESSAIRDYDVPPYVVVGTLEDQSVDEVLDLYQTISAEQIVTDTQTAALVKYACNAYHALKISFANEIGSLAQTFDGDGLVVMDIVCRDTKLNISQAYLKPGFAFGGSCLPKDLRAITRHAEKQALRVPLLEAILPSNDDHLQRAIQAVQETGCRRLGLIGLSFKSGTDDLRESPFVTLAETLLGKGCDVKIYDPGVALPRLKGQNLAFIDQHLPHLAALLVDSPEKIEQHADLLILGTSVADKYPWSEKFCDRTIDLRRDLVVAAKRTI